MPEPLRVELREVDALIAEHLFGWTLKSGREFGSPETNREGNLRGMWTRPVPLYSRLETAAWTVVELMRQTTKETWTFFVCSNSVQATFSYEGGKDKPWRVGDFEAIEDSLPAAVCLAALRAVGLDVELAPEALPDTERSEP